MTASHCSLSLMSTILSHSSTSASRTLRSLAPLKVRSILYNMGGGAEKFAKNCTHTKLQDWRENQWSLHVNFLTDLGAFDVVVFPLLYTFFANLSCPVCAVIPIPGNLLLSLSLKELTCVWEGSCNIFLHCAYCCCCVGDS